MGVIKHTFVNPIADEPGFLGTKPSHWNADHDISGLTAADVGLGNVNNTSDANKPVSTAQAAADTAVGNAAATDATTKANAAQSAAQTYADGLVVGLWDDRGSFNASGNVFPSSGGSGAAGAIKKGDIWTISVAGTLGGAAVAVGDLVRALVDTPGATAGNWCLTSHDLGYTAENSSNKDASGGYSGLTLFKLNLRNVANTITSWFTTAATVARTWTMPDKDGTVAMTSDITGTNSGVNSGDQTSVTGNAGTATTLQTARNIGGVPFNGSADIDPGIRVVARTTSWTLALTDRNTEQQQTHASPQVCTIPTNATVAFTGPTKISLARYGAGSLTLTGAAGVSLNGVTAGSVAIDRWQIAILTWIAADTWIVSGTAADPA